jgi:beta-glucanase (GH16 family)
MSSWLQNRRRKRCAVNLPLHNAGQASVKRSVRRRRIGAGLAPALSLGLAVPFAAPAATPGADSFAEEVVWGINLGGEALSTRAGERLRADDCEDKGRAGRCGELGAVSRTQNQALFRTFRRGDQQYSLALEDGAYDVLLYFVDPGESGGVRRSVDVVLEGEPVLAGLALPQASPGRAAPAMTRAFPRIPVADGALNIAVTGREGEAVLCAILVRRSRFATDGWTVSWSDEFEGGALSVDNWAAETWDPGRVNHELQAYTPHSRNVRVEDGRLILEAHAGGETSPEFTSGRVHGWGKHELQYGRLDIRARVPGGRGAWPALWLLPDDPYRYATNCHSDEREWQGDGDCDAWPNSGEIDLMEHIGYEPGVVHGTVHTRDYYSRLGTQVGEAIVVPDLGEAFHTYTLLWQPGQLSMYIDGVRYFAYFDDGVGYGQWPFDHPFYVVMNLAVGGDWGAALGPVVAADFPRRLEVDYVRIYRSLDRVSP